MSTSSGAFDHGITIVSDIAGTGVVALATEVGDDPVVFRNSQISIVYVAERRCIIDEFKLFILNTRTDSDQFNQFPITFTVGKSSNIRYPFFDAGADEFFPEDASDWWSLEVDEQVELGEYDISPGDDRILEPGEVILFHFVPTNTLPDEVYSTFFDESSSSSFSSSSSSSSSSESGEAQEGYLLSDFEESENPPFLTAEYYLVEADPSGEFDELPDLPSRQTVLGNKITQSTTPVFMQARAILRIRAERSGQ